MTRRRYYKPYKRSYSSKKKWATCMKRGRLTFSVNSGSGHAEDVLVANSTQAATPTPVIVKTGNFKIQGDCYVTGNGGANVQDTSTVTLYVMYLPEVVVSSANVITTVNDHPEWILAWKVLDINPGSPESNSASFSFSSRLKRNLNSGDTIALVAIGTDSNSFTPYFAINYTCQYWTCSN